MAARAMSPQAYFLYVISVLIWGSTWIAIKFQLGEVNPMVSVIYRFGIASALLFAWCLLARARIRLNLVEHAFVALQGACLFGINVWLTYWSEVYLTGGVVAVVFALTVLMNSFNAALFLRRPVVRPCLPVACWVCAGSRYCFGPRSIGSGLSRAPWAVCCSRCWRRTAHRSVPSPPPTTPLSACR